MFKKIIAAITGFFSKEIPVVEDAFTKASNLVNVVKTFLGSATGQTLEAIVELAFPGASQAIFGALNTFFTDFGIVQSEVSKTPAEIAADGLNAIAKLTGDSKTIALSNIAAVIGNATTGNQSTIQQAIVSLPVIYNPNVLGSPVQDVVANSTTPTSDTTAVPTDPNA